VRAAYLHSLTIQPLPLIDDLQIIALSPSLAARVSVPLKRQWAGSQKEWSWVKEGGRALPKVWEAGSLDSTQWQRVAAKGQTFSRVDEADDLAACSSSPQCKVPAQPIGDLSRAIEKSLVLAVQHHLSHSCSTSRVKGVIEMSRCLEHRTATEYYTSD
jgi:hypothetical protein